MAVVRRREYVSNLAGVWNRIGIGHVEREAVGHHALRVHERNDAIRDGVRVQLERRHAVGLVVQLAEGEANGIFEVPTLRLKMVLREVHALVPYYLRQKRHVAPW